MAKDYKNRRTPKNDKRTGKPGWLWFGTGLGCGLLVALGVYLQSPQQVRLSELERELAPASKPTPADVAAVKPRETQDKKPTAQFEFYTKLRDMEVKVPQTSVAPRESAPAGRKSAQAVSLQVGSFRKIAEADRLKAQVVLLGLNAGIESVDIADGTTWHRVQVGPFGDNKTLNQAKKRLQHNDINAIIQRAGT